MSLVRCFLWLSLLVAITLPVRAQTDLPPGIDGALLAPLVPARLGNARRTHLLEQAFAVAAAFREGDGPYINLDVQSVFSPGLVRSQASACRRWEEMGGRRGCVNGTGPFSIVWTFEEKISVTLGRTDIDTLRVLARDLDMPAIERVARAAR